MLFYQNSNSSAQEKDEKVIRTIIKNNLRPKQAEDSIHLNIYYKNRKTSSLVMKNNLSQDSSDMKATDVVYQFDCRHGDCARRRDCCYIGHTTTTLSRRLTCHLQQGALLKHMQTSHNSVLTRQEAVQQTSIIARSHNKRKLQALGAAFIRDINPIINIQMKLVSHLSLYDSAPLRLRN